MIRITLSLLAAAGTVSPQTHPAHADSGKTLLAALAGVVFIFSLVLNPQEQQMTAQTLPSASVRADKRRSTSSAWPSQCATDSPSWTPPQPLNLVRFRFLARARVEK